MITMNELVDLRMQQHIAHEIYRQQIMQRIPDPFPPMLPMHMPRHVIMPPRVTLPGVEVTLQNDDLWKQFHQIGTEMIITKSGRRMFPSMRITVSGLEEESNYCVLLEMVPIGDCRYKFSGSQWVPAGGAEPQSPQRMYLHPDSPASGAHWQAQPILFSKVKLTNNTLDSNGHVVLASMHKYQPRIHVIRTSDLAQIPWAPQQAFVFPETEFVAVTAYQNDRITKLKIDNNPFAKGFRETGQSRCKRKMSSSPSDADAEDQDQQQQQHHHHQQQQQQATSGLARHSQNDMSPTKSALTTTTDSATSSICSSERANSTSLAQHEDTAVHLHDDGPQIKRMRSNGSACSLSSLDEFNGGGGGGIVTGSGVMGIGIASPASETSSPTTAAPTLAASQLMLSANRQHFAAYAGTGTGAGSAVDATATASAAAAATSSFMHHFQQNMQTLLRPSLVDLACTYFGRPQPIYPPPSSSSSSQQQQQQQQQQSHLYHHQHGNGNMQQHVVEAPPLLQLPQLTMPVPMPASVPLPMPMSMSLPLPLSSAGESTSSALAALPLPAMTLPTCISVAPPSVSQSNETPTDDVDVGSEASSLHAVDLHQQQQQQQQRQQHEDECDFERSPPPKRKGFSISAILGGGS